MEDPLIILVVELFVISLLVSFILSVVKLSLLEKSRLSTLVCPSSSKLLVSYKLAIIVITIL